MSRLYAIVDHDALERRGLDLLPFALAVLEARPWALQIRAKTANARAILEWLEALLPLCAAAGAALVVNDRLDIALAAGSEWVHLGQGDLSLAQVRALAPAMNVGLSTHSLSQLETALDANPAYVAYGPIFPTSSKMNAEPSLGTDGLRLAAKIVRERTTMPLVAIGGITLETLQAVARWSDAVAVIGALLPPPGVAGAERYRAVAERAHALARALHEESTGEVTLPDTPPSSKPSHS